MAGFDNSTQRTRLFGAPAAASTSDFSFGKTTQAKPMFGNTGATNTFGATNSLFGQTPQTQNAGLFGKKVGFRAPTTSAAPSFNFGASTGTSLCGQSNQQKPLFGQTTAGTGLFGAPASTQPNAFGTNTAFVAPVQQTGGLLGAKPTEFGVTNTTTTNNCNFGNANNMTGGGLFGVKSTAPAFGTTGFGTQSTGFGFGTTPTASTGLFGQPKPATSAFSNTGTSLSPGFGTSSFNMGLGTKTGTGQFGSANANKAPDFNFNNTGSTGFGGFGTTPTANTGLFGQPKPATSAFGNTGTGVGTGFGTSSFNMGLGTKAGTGQFGSADANKAPGFNFNNTGLTGFGFGTTFPQNSPTTSLNTGYDPNSMLLQQQTQKQILAMTANPYGDSPLFRNVIKNPVRQEEVLKPTNPSAKKALLTNNHYKVSPLPAAKIKPMPLTPLSNRKRALFDGLEDEEPSLGNATFVPKRSVKKLVLRRNVSSPSSFTQTSNLTTSSNQPTQNNFPISLQKSPEIVTDCCRQCRITQGMQQIAERPPAALLTVDITSPLSRITAAVNANESSSLSDVTYCKQILPDVTESNKLADTTATLHTKDPKQSGRPFDITNDSDSGVSEADDFSETASYQQLDLSKNDTLSSHPTRIVLKRPGYYTIPPLYEMTPLVDNNGDCFVTNFTIICEGYGKVTFPGLVNVAGLNLDEIVEFRKKEIIIYHDDENKPPISQGLNRKAVVTLEGVWPTDKTTHKLIKDPERLRKMGYIEKIEKSTICQGAKFIDYRLETGSWVFMVSHFSKYGLQDSEMEEPTRPQDEEKSVMPPKKVIPKINGAIPTQNFMQQLNDPLSLQDEEEQMEGVTCDVHKDCENNNGIQNSMLSLSISASHSELLSSFPMMKNSVPSCVVAPASKPLTMAINSAPVF